MRVFWRLAYVGWFGACCVASLFSAKVRRGLAGRRGLIARVAAFKKKHAPPAHWVHFASSGEFEQALPIVAALKAAQPGVPIFLTTFSPSGWRAIALEARRLQEQGEAPPWAAWDYSPLDFPTSVRAFLRTLQPRSVTILNREFWPEVLHQLKRAGIPTAVFAVFFSENARTKLGWQRAWLSGISYFGTLDEASRQVLQKLLPGTRVEVLGDPRVDRVLRRKERALSRPAPFAFRKPLFVGASLWAPDFEALLGALWPLREAAWQVALVPHEPSESLLRRFEMRLEKEGIQAHRWSRGAGADAPVLLVDEVGWLAELYRFADLALVGGSFKARVHNVLEPAAYGVPILTGPYIRNSCEAREMNQEHQGLWVCEDAASVRRLVQKAIDNPEWLRQQGLVASAYLERRKGAGERSARRVLELSPIGA